MVRLLIIFTALMFSSAYAEQKYNPYDGRWETTTPDAELQYNPYEGNWQYTAPDADIEYNPYEGKWEYPNSGSTPSKSRRTFDPSTVKPID